MFPIVSMSIDKDYHSLIWMFNLYDFSIVFNIICFRIFFILYIGIVNKNGVRSFYLSKQIGNNGKIAFSNHFFWYILRGLFRRMAKEMAVPLMGSCIMQRLPLDAPSWEYLWANHCNLRHFKYFILYKMRYWWYLNFCPFRRYFIKHILTNSLRTESCTLKQIYI